MKVQRIQYAVLAADLLWIFGALAGAIRLRYPGSIDEIGLMRYFQTYSLMLLVAAVVWAFLYFEMSLDGFNGGWHLPTILSKVIVAVTILMLAVPAFAFLVQRNYSRLVLLYFAVLFTFGLIVARCLSRLVVASYLRNMLDNRCVILGNGPVAREVAAKIASHPEMPFHVVGFLFPGDSEASNGFATSRESAVTSIKTLQVLELLAKEKIQKVIVAMSQPIGGELQKLIAECRKAALQVYLIPQWYDLYVSRAELIEVDGLPLLSLEERKRPITYFTVKRAMDVVLSAGILILVAPLLIVASLVVYSRKGRAFRTELRCGKDGIPFRMYRLNVERPSRSLERYERLFVRWSLTELPQLWNVLRGEMSLVGPRPESVDRLKCYSEWQRQRLKIRAGVTGLAQIHGLREQHSSEDKTRFDLQYILNWSPLWDLSLVLQTVWTLVFRGLNQEPAFPQAARFSSAPGVHASRKVADAHRS